MSFHVKKIEIRNSHNPLNVFCPRILSAKFEAFVRKLNFAVLWKKLVEGRDYFEPETA